MDTTERVKRQIPEAMRNAYCAEEPRHMADTRRGKEIVGDDGLE